MHNAFQSIYQKTGIARSINKSLLCYNFIYTSSWWNM